MTTKTTKTTKTATDAPVKRGRGRPRKWPVEVKPPREKKPVAGGPRKARAEEKKVVQKKRGSKIDEEMSIIYKELFGADSDWDHKEVLPNNVIFNELLDRWLFEERTQAELYEATGMNRQRYHEYRFGKRPCPMYVWVRMMRILNVEVVFRAHGISVRKAKSKEGDFDYAVKMKTLEDIL